MTIFQCRAHIISLISILLSHFTILALHFISLKIVYKEDEYILDFLLTEEAPTGETFGLNK